MTQYQAKITVFLIALALTVASCGSRSFNHGNRIEPAILAQIEVGTTRRVEVEALLGRPSVSGAFDSGTDYYVAQIMHQRPAGRKETVERQVIAFSYNDNGIVTAIDISDETSGRQVYHSDETTPTPGDTFGILEQIIRNLQRGRR